MNKDEALFKALVDVKYNAGNPEKVYRIASAAIKQALVAPDLQAELEATNRQVEILSDALAESRREVAAKNEALRLALKALEYLMTNKTIHYTYRDKAEEAITAVKQARAAQQEPVAWLENLKRLASICPELNMVNYSEEDVDDLNCWAIEVATCIDSITNPPAAQRKPVDLTNDEINNIANGCHLGKSVQGAIREALDKYKEKNT
jgi:hypothetical protein